MRRIDFSRQVNPAHAPAQLTRLCTPMRLHTDYLRCTYVHSAFAYGISLIINDTLFSNSVLTNYYHKTCSKFHSGPNPHAEEPNPNSYAASKSLLYALF